MSGYRCDECGHRPKRAVTATSKKAAPPKLHKKPCGCDCHTPKAAA